MKESLGDIGSKYHADKKVVGYLPFYDKYLDAHRSGFSNILEIGIRGGRSLCMWHDYFTNSTIHGIDLSSSDCLQKNAHEESLELPMFFQRPRIKTYVCDQSDRDSLIKLFQNIKFDFIIDDGGHHMNEQQTSLAVLFNYLKSGGYYAIEDLHTSFPCCKGGGFVDRNSSITSYDMINKLKNGQDFNSSYMSQSESNYIISNTKFAEIHKGEYFNCPPMNCYITSLIQKK